MDFHRSLKRKTFSKFNFFAQNQTKTPSLVLEHQFYHLLQKIKCKAPCDECCDRSIGKPVCACHKDGIKRYTNACYAMMLGVKKVFKCPHQCGTMYKPVCGTNGETYHNSCFAKVAKTAVECKHKCPCESMESPESFHWRENSAESIEDWRRK